MPVRETLSCPPPDRSRRSDPRPARLFTSAKGVINEFVVFAGISFG
jgi:hypothetical protein